MLWGGVNTVTIDVQIGYTASTTPITRLRRFDKMCSNSLQNFSRMLQSSCTLLGLVFLGELNNEIVVLS